MLNWKKCHLLIQEGIVLGRQVSRRGLEVNRAKIETIEKIPPPVSVREMHSVLGHVSFYRRFMVYKIFF